MMRSNEILKFVLAVTCMLTIKTFSEAADAFNTSQTIADGDSLISSDGAFELGFFRPGNSRNRYVGIWYRTIPAFTVVWVANRDRPLPNTNSSGGVLKLGEDGILALVDSSNVVVWSSNASRVGRNPVVKLLDSGNLVVEDDSSEEYLWQSFDYPTDTILPGMKFGKNLVTGHESSITAWKSSDDPGTGEYSYHLEPPGYPQTVLRKASEEIFRTGPWNGVGFSGTPGLKVNSIYTFQLVVDEKEVYYKYQLLNKSVVSRFVMNQSGAAQRWTWVGRTQGWVLYLTYPTDNCDAFRLCGVYGSCNVGNSPICGCLPKFVPRFADQWAEADWSNGCVRRVPLDCKTDGFVKYNDIKLPDTVHSWFNSSMSLKECRQVCLKNCSCMAYSSLDIRNGGSGCLLWLEDLADIKVVYGAGQDIYVKVAASELGDVRMSRELREMFSLGEVGSRRKKRNLLVAGLTSLMGMILLGIGFLVYTWRKKTYLKLQKGGLHRESDNNDMDLPSFHLTTISKATNNFSLPNKLGEGGFGPVYKGTLEDGQEIAVKRLSKTSAQGVNEFKNEVIFIAKLQHRNLVKLLGCCIQGEEKMLVYEYMPNKSLDLILFDEEKSVLLDWPKRSQIISGIARGLMYLHQDSRLRIIHRDLKASNILLDADMNPKISDFGLARMFGENESEANTSRVVGTYGYISPEFAIDGTFSVKSDVFSFGVIMLEILSGKRNRGYSHTDHRHNLVGHAWLLYKEGRSLELVNISGDKEELHTCSEILRCVHIGLLCVQRYPEDRPNMSAVVFMLENKQVLLPQAKEPGFFTERGVFGSDASTSTKATSTNEITITLLEAR